MRKSIVFNSWSQIAFQIVEIFLGLILGIWLGKSFIYYHSSLAFCAFIFVLIALYFYHLFFRWFIKQFMTWILKEDQFSQIIQSAKFEDGGVYYQVDKINNLQLSFDSRLVKIQGTLLIPNQNNLKLNFSVNTSFDYYNFHWVDHLRKIGFTLKERKTISPIWVLFHLVLLTYSGIIFSPLLQEKSLNQQFSKIGKLNQHFSKTSKTEDYLLRLAIEPFPPHVKEEIQKEIYGLSQNPFSHNREIKEERIEQIMSLPWYQQSPETNDLTLAQNKLDQEHYGLESVKTRIIEYLADKQKGTGTEQILCLISPPGTGKTSISKAIARSLGREFQRLSLGGVHDEGEIRGHRQTYIGSKPGIIIQAMKKAGKMNPVILLDEIDKIGESRFHGDPSSALLEILDPEQNNNFRDNYIEIPYDLSKVMFICTANSEENIPFPLRDRLEVIKLDPYDESKKLAIANKKILPRLLSQKGISQEKLNFEEGAIRKIIRNYTREAGVRNLERSIQRIIRKFILKGISKEIITAEKVKDYLGNPLPEIDFWDHSQPGIVNGLMVSSESEQGTVSPIEVTCSPKKGEKAELIITGNLKETMKESAQVALSYVKTNCQKFGIKSNFFANNDIHIHAPRGGIPKDGPSAGTALTTAIISAARGQAIPNDIGMTGEITLLGNVLAIGGLKAKINSAAYKLKTIFIPKHNENDLMEISTEGKNKLEIILVDNYEQVWDKIRTRI